MNCSNPFNAPEFVLAFGAVIFIFLFGLVLFKGFKNLEAQGVTKATVMAKDVKKWGFVFALLVVYFVACTFTRFCS